MSNFKFIENSLDLRKIVLLNDKPLLLYTDLNWKISLHCFINYEDAYCSMGHQMQGHGGGGGAEGELKLLSVIHKVPNYWCNISIAIKFYINFSEGGMIVSCTNL